MRYRQNTKGDILYGPPVTGIAKIIDPLFVLTKSSSPISKKHSCIDHLCASSAQ